MQFVVERDVFLAELSRICGVIETRNTIPICGHVFIDVGHGGLIMRTTNLDMEAETLCAATTSKTGLTTINGKLLSDFVKRCPEGENISATWLGAKQQMQFACGRIRGAFPTLPAEDFPQFQTMGQSVEFSITASAFRRLLEKTKFAVGTDARRPHLHGSYLHVSTSHLAAAATDGYRLSAVHEDLPAGCENIEGVILPPDFIAEAVRVLPKDGDVSIVVSENLISLAFGDFRLTSKLLAGIFPDYRCVIPHAPRNQAVFDRKAMLAAVERMRIVLDTTSESIQLTFAPGEIRLAARNNDGGRMFDAIEAECQTEETIIGANNRQLTSLLSALDGERVCLDFGTPGDVMKITDAEGNGPDVMVLMPMPNVAIKEDKEAA